ncbi:MAG TPA: cation diffusion facilitator family transporter [Nitrososphaeraceae archaeon]|nr:cation diffusion facilitator family transporter [Nitrososphaeraceae archaeon]
MSSQQINKLKIVLLLILSYIVVEVISGLLTGSLALIADAGHMLADAGGLTLALFAINFSSKPATPQRTYGFYRIEILAALANSAVLILVSVYIIYDAYERIIEPPQIKGTALIIVGTIGLVVNLVGMYILKGHANENLNIEGAYLEVLKDTLGSVGVVVVGVITSISEFYLVDPIISIGLAFYILPRIWSLMKKSINILMEGVPINISYEEVKKAILQIKGVTGVFDIHIWTITSGMDAITAHVVVSDPSKSQIILKEISSILENRFKITHTTIQIETYHT